MYIVAQISPLEWKKASVCSHCKDDDDEDENVDDDEINDTEFHHHHSLNSFDGHEHEDFMTNREDEITKIINENCCSTNAFDNDRGGDNDEEVNGNLKDNDEQIESGVEAVEEGNCYENDSISTLQQYQQYLKNMCVMNEQNDLESIWMNMEYRQNFLLNARKQNHQNHEQEFRKRQKQKQYNQQDENFDKNNTINNITNKNERTRKSIKKRQKKQYNNEIGSSNKHFDENLDIDDDGLIGYVDEQRENEDYNNSSEVDFDEDEYDNEDDNYNNGICLDDNYSQDLSFTTLDEMQNIELISYVNNFSLKNSFAWTLGTLMQSTSDLYPKVTFFIKKFFRILPLFVLSLVWKCWEILYLGIYQF